MEKTAQARAISKHFCRVPKNNIPSKIPAFAFPESVRSVVGYGQLLGFGQNECGKGGQVKTEATFFTLRRISVTDTTQSFVHFHFPKTTGI